MFELIVVPLTSFHSFNFFFNLFSAPFSGRVALSIWMMVNAGLTEQPLVKGNPTDPSLRTAWTRCTGTYTKKPVVLFLIHRKASETIYRTLYERPCQPLNESVWRHLYLYAFLYNRCSPSNRLEPNIFLQMVTYHSQAFVTEECAVSNVKTLQYSHNFQFVTRLSCHVPITIDKLKNRFFLECSSTITLLTFHLLG